MRFFTTNEMGHPVVQNLSIKSLAPAPAPAPASSKGCPQYFSRRRGVVRGVARAVPRDLPVRVPVGGAQGAERAAPRRLHLEALGKVRGKLQGQQGKWGGECSKKILSTECAQCPKEILNMMMTVDKSDYYSQFLIHQILSWPLGVTWNNLSAIDCLRSLKKPCIF